MKILDLFSGLGGWSAALRAELPYGLSFAMCLAAEKDTEAEK